MDIKSEINSFIVKNILANQSIEDFSMNLDLIEMGILDSISIVNLINFIDEKLGIKLDLSEVTPENFKTIDTIAQFLSNHENR